jgi:preprotein translocase subunit SecA
MIQKVLAKVFGTRHEREMKRLAPLTAHIASLESGIEKLTDDELRDRTNRFRQEIANGKTIDEVLPEAFAVCREGARRSLGMRHYDVQMIGGMVLHRGSIAEMRTGEGKTLTATLPLYLNALTGKGAHLVTVNDYLAARDAEWMGKLYGFLGLTTGTIVPRLSTSQRRQSYACDITYGTNSEFGFDYLRDNMQYKPTDRTQRGLHFAIVDEVDSILVDEARTPLIISGSAELNEKLYREVNAIIVDLRRDQDYLVDEEHRSVTLTDDGIETVQKRLGIQNLFDPANITYLHHTNKALEAHTLYRRDERYLVIDGEVVIVDEFTGRKMQGRRWSDGLHQAIEAKEGLAIKPESETLATITYQNFFRMYSKLSGMTGTAETEAEEFTKTYDLMVHVIPTNRPVVRVDQGDVVFLTEREKFNAIVEQIIVCHEKGQPVLVGTVSVDKSEVISKVLKKRGIVHNVLNAKQHEREADIVAQAGRKGAVTIATNMAGRGTDILLGGNPENLARGAAPDATSDEYKTALTRFESECAAEKQEVRKAGGLFILGTERHESRRIDNQLRGRAGRQGDPGESRFFLSLEDDLMRRFGAEKITAIMSRLGMQEGEPIESPMVTRAVENAQTRVEGRNFDMRKHLLEYDDVMNVQRKAIYDLRRHILEDEDLFELALDVLDDCLSGLLNSHCAADVRMEDWNMKGLTDDLKTLFGFELDPESLPRNRQTLESQLWPTLRKELDKKIEAMEPLLESAREERTATGRNPDDVSTRTVFTDVFRDIYLRELDRNWRGHLTRMTALRESVGLHGYAQKDPKFIYKKEGFELYATMRRSINNDVATNVLRATIRATRATRPTAAPNLELRPQGLASMANTGGLPAHLAAAMGRAARATATGATGAIAAASTTGATAAVGGADAPAPVRALPKLGRNDMCWCGSGVKYKKCHMRADYEKAGIPLPASMADDAGADAANS